MSKHLHFKLTGMSKGGLLWSVLREEEPRLLGGVMWWVPWRRYVFLPAEDRFFDAEQLTEIAAFIRGRTGKRRT